MARWISATFSVVAIFDAVTAKNLWNEVGWVIKFRDTIVDDLVVGTTVSTVKKKNLQNLIDNKIKEELNFKNT